MEENRDIAISRALLELYPSLRPILAYTPLEEYFANLDKQAARRKYWFVRLGTLSIVFVCIVLILLAFQMAFMIFGRSLPFAVEIVGAALGILAVAIQLTIHFSKLQEKWLVLRYEAERIRLWKFQLFLDGDFLCRIASAESKQTALQELDLRWAVFLESFKSGGIGGMQNYIDDRSEVLIERDTKFVDDASALSAGDAYRRIRIQSELDHFENKYLELEPLDRLTDSWARVLLVCSGAIALMHISFLLLHSLQIFGASLSPFLGNLILVILAVTALTLAVTSAGIRVYRHAAMIAEERERYKAKQTPLVKLRDSLRDQSEAVAIKSVMKETEMVCIEELQDFVRVMRRADYFF